MIHGIQTTYCTTIAFNKSSEREREKECVVLERIKSIILNCFDVKSHEGFYGISLFLNQWRDKKETNPNRFKMLNINGNFNRTIIQIKLLSLSKSFLQSVFFQLNRIFAFELH